MSTSYLISPENRSISRCFLRDSKASSYPYEKPYSLLCWSGIHFIAFLLHFTPIVAPFNN